MSRKSEAHNILSTILAAGMAGRRHDIMVGKPCEHCRQPIVGGDGYRWIPNVGNVHGRCVEAHEAAKGEGKDAKQGQANGG